MKLKVFLVIVLSFCCGCMPASQQEVMELHSLVEGIVPIIRENASENVAEVLDHLETVNESVATAESPVDAIEKGWKASEPFNPYYGYGAAILAALKLFSDNRKKRELESKYSAAKVGMDKFRNENPDKAAELYNNVGEARKAKKIA